MSRPSVLTLLLVVPAWVVGQPAPQTDFDRLTPTERQAVIEEAWARHTTVTSGHANAAGVSFADKMTVAFRRVEKDRARSDDAGFQKRMTERFGATAADYRILDQAARENASRMSQIDADASAKIDDVCARVLSGTLQGAVAVAAEMDALDREYAAQVDRYYRATLERLSSSTRARLLGFAEAQATNMVVGTTNRTGFATDVPQIYAAHMKRHCENRGSDRPTGDVLTPLPH